MIYNNTSTALLLDHTNFKDSLIYYDTVIPLFHPTKVIYSIKEENAQKEIQNALNQVLPTDLKKNGKNEKFYGEFLHNDLFLLLFFRKIHKFGYEYVKDPYSLPETMHFLQVRETLFQKLDQNSKFVNQGVFISSQKEENFKESDDVRLSLLKLKLIDTSNVSFETLFDLRKDKESINKFRQLRLFFYQNYNGKSKAFIEDDLLKRLHDYEETAKQWNLKTTLSSIDSFLSSKTLTASVIGAIGSAFMGDLTTSALAFSSGVSIEIGKLVVNIKKESLSKNEQLRKDPISFFYNLKKLE